MVAGFSDPILSAHAQKIQGRLKELQQSFSDGIASTGDEFQRILMTSADRQAALIIQNLDAFQKSGTYIYSSGHNLAILDDLIGAMAQMQPQALGQAQDAWMTTAMGFRQQIQDSAKTLGIKLDKSAFSRTSLELIQVASNNSFSRLSDFANLQNQTLTNLRREAADGMARGINWREIAKQVQGTGITALEAIPGFRRAFSVEERGRLIGRTEVVRIQTQLQTDQGLQAGMTMARSYLNWALKNHMDLCLWAESLGWVPIHMMSGGPGMPPRHPACGCNLQTGLPEWLDADAMAKHAKEFAKNLADNKVKVPGAVAAKFPPQVTDAVAAEGPEKITIDPTKTTISTPPGAEQFPFDDLTATPAALKKTLEDKGLQIEVKPSPAKLAAIEAEKLAALQAQVAAKAKADAEAAAAKTAENVIFDAIAPVSMPALQSIDLHKDIASWSGGTVGKRAYGGVIFNEEGQVLLRRPTGLFGGYHWTFPKGGQKGSQHGAEAAVMEVGEETGHIGEIVGIVPGGFKGTTSTTFMFLMRSKGHDPALMDTETDRTMWVHPEDAKHFIEKTTSKEGKNRDLAILEGAVKAWASLKTGKQNPDLESAIAAAQAKLEPKKAVEHPVLPGKMEPTTQADFPTLVSISKDKSIVGKMKAAADAALKATPGVIPSAVNVLKKLIGKKEYFALSDAEQIDTISEIGRYMYTNLQKPVSIIPLPSAGSEFPTLESMSKNPFVVNDMKAVVDAAIVKSAGLTPKIFTILESVIEPAVYKTLSIENTEKLFKEVGDYIDKKMQMQQPSTAKPQPFDPFAAADALIVQPPKTPIIDSLASQGKLQLGLTSAITQAKSMIPLKSKKQVKASDVAFDLLGSAEWTALKASKSKANMKLKSDLLAEIDAVLHPGGSAAVAAPTPAGIQFGQAVPMNLPSKPPLLTDESAFPKDLSKLKTIKKLGGSTGAELVEDPATGKRYVMKRGKNAGHLRAEIASDAVYRAAGVLVPAFHLYENATGGPVKLSEYMEGTRTLDSIMRGKDDALKAKVMKQLHEDFGLDALLGNWDVIGQDRDNVLVDAEGKAWRIDNGGTLNYRAQGKKKEGEEWTTHPDDLWSMRDKAKSATAAAVFGQVPWYTVAESLKRVSNLEKQIVKLVPEDQQETFKARLSELEHIAHAGVKHQADGFDQAFSESITKTMYSIRKAGLTDRVPKAMISAQTRAPGKGDMNYFKEFNVEVKDAAGTPFDDLRSHGKDRSATLTALESYVKTIGGDWSIISEYASSQASSSWKSEPLAIKYYIAKRIFNLSDAQATAEAYWNGSSIDQARTAYQNMVAKYGEQKIATTLQAAMAFTYEIISNMDLPNKLDRDTFAVVRTETHKVVSHYGLKKGEKNQSFNRGMLESASLFRAISASEEAKNVMTYKLPIHRMFLTYLQSRSAANHGGAFMTSAENEVTFMPFRTVFDFQTWKPQ